MNNVLIWKDVVGYEGLYQVSNTGLVRSLTRTIIDKNGYSRTIKGTAMRLQISDIGYIRVGLRVTNTNRRFSVHRLVAVAFKDNPNNLPQVNHLDGIKTNNHVENLEWSSPSDNLKHAHRTGLKSGAGEKHSQSKLTEVQVIDIRTRYSTGIITQAALAKEYLVHPETIGDIVRGRNWSHITI